MKNVTYEVLVSESGYKSIRKTDENGIVSIIPSDPANSDYVAYLASLDEPSSNTE